jgi:hypothetical protein
MFCRHDITLTNNPHCWNTAEVDREDFRYYDKDGFELNQAEQKFYAANDLPLNDVLNHLCWQEPWFELEDRNNNLILDHSMFLCRASYEGPAREQLSELKPTIPTADLLLRTRQKWGFDFALDAVSNDGTVFEVLHVEYDNYDYEQFKQELIMFDHRVRHTDWQDSALLIWCKRDEWQHLKGFEQNHWKSKYLIGWSKAEYTEKAV